MILLINKLINYNNNNNYNYYYYYNIIVFYYILIYNNINYLLFVLFNKQQLN